MKLKATCTVCEHFNAYWVCEKGHKPRPALVDEKRFGFFRICKDFSTRYIPTYKCTEKFLEKLKKKANY